MPYGKAGEQKRTGNSIIGRTACAVVFFDVGLITSLPHHLITSSPSEFSMALAASNSLIRLVSVAALLTLAAPSRAAGPGNAAESAAAPAAGCNGLLQQSYLRLQDEKPQSLCQYRGKVVVIVNTASFCGFTFQYKGLEALYSRYKDRGHRRSPTDSKRFKDSAKKSLNRFESVGGCFWKFVARCAI